MAKDDETLNGEVNDGTDEQKVTIAGVEMTEAEAKELLDSGKTMKELRSQYPDIDFKELPKAFTQTRQELADFKKKSQTQTPEKLDDEEEARRKQIKDFFADPDVKLELEKIQADKEKQIKEDLQIEKTLENLESEFDGSDGRPKFDRNAVLKYGMENNIFNPRAAYKEMHETELEEWSFKKRLEKKRPTTSFEKAGSGGGSKQPEVKPATSFKEATANALAAEEEN